MLDANDYIVFPYDMGKVCDWQRCVFQTQWLQTRPTHFVHYSRGQARIDVVVLKSKQVTNLQDLQCFLVISACTVTDDLSSQ